MKIQLKNHTPEIPGTREGRAGADTVGLSQEFFISWKGGSHERGKKGKSV
jgi:hypothetical protein